nr:hypothetical protein [Oscillochloris sp. ZM17-4]
MTTTPKLVKLKMKTSSAAAPMDGASSGSVTSQIARRREAPSMAAACSSRGSRLAQRPPTMRSTTV